MKKRIISFIITCCIMGIFLYVQLPVLKLDFISLYVSLIFFLLIYGVLNINFKIQQVGQLLGKVEKFCFIGAGGIVIFLIIVPFIVSTPFFHAKAYRNLIGEVKEGNFTSDMAPVDLENIRLVDKQNANNLGVKKLGEVPGLGSVAKIGEFHIQRVQDKLYWIAPVVHRDAIKWITNLQGTTGYIMVSATNPQDVQFIQEVDGKPLRIVYQPEAYLNQDLRRHLYLNGLNNIGLTDFTLEVDDKGYPYWVVTLYEHKVGFGGEEAVGVATVDPMTGEVNKYSIEEAPAWIDRIQPESFIETQITTWGAYVKGYINAMLAEEGVLAPTPGTSLVYGEDGKSYWYTGITSSGADDSTIGFMLVDTRTKEAKLYKQSGATELAAMSSAEGKVQEKGYSATAPIMYNILGSPTYAISLKDKAGLIKMIAFVSVEDYSLVGMGETKQEALRSYKDLLKSRGNKVNMGIEAETKQLKGKVTRIGSEVQDGKTTYFLMIDKLQGKMMSITSDISQEIALTEVGDEVSISYDTYQDTLEVVAFDNLVIH